MESLGFGNRRRGQERRRYDDVVIVGCAELADDIFMRVRARTMLSRMRDRAQLCDYQQRQQQIASMLRRRNHSVSLALLAA